MTASIIDVAREAGVSVATVSRALRGLPNVAEHTRRRVTRAAEELQYVADANASRLAAGRTMSIGVLVNSLSNWYMAQIASGVEATASAAGYDVVLYQSERLGSPALISPATTYRKRVDGLIVAIPVPHPSLVEELAASDLPVVTAGAIWPNFLGVGVDDWGAAATATRHLINLGHERIALIGDDPSSGNHQAAARRRGYQDALSTAGRDIDPDLDMDGRFTVTGGAEAMATLLSGGRLPTGIFAMSDEMALGALRTLTSAGLAVPDDLSIVGFDDHQIARCTQLTTISQPVTQIGEVAASLLLERLADGRNPADTGKSVALGTKLCVRTTTGPSHRGRKLQEARR